MLEGNEETSSYRFCLLHQQEKKVVSLCKDFYFVKSDILELLMNIFLNVPELQHVILAGRCLDMYAIPIYCLGDFQRSYDVKLAMYSNF